MPVAVIDEFKGKPPVQLIVMGCPGSGKSHLLREYAKDIPDGFVFMATFHQELAYGDFVGAYKPIPVYVPSTHAHTVVYNADGSPVEESRKNWIPVIKYDYRPGPMINAYLTAVLHPEEEVVLIIDEINRANPAAVFGDFLQLLDRDHEGNSDYDIDTPDDLKTYLASKLEHALGREAALLRASKIKLPSNLYIWGTMNRADESVNYIDSAFLRRWGLKYIPYVTPSEYGHELIRINGEDMLWDDFRSKLNARLAAMDGIEDDKFVGPYFLKKSEIASANAVFSKLITYLWHDVVTMDRPELFDGKSLGQIYEKWMGNKSVIKLVK
jgi:5-methylcytosine-specific restriction endonuclease McrBC GTP-binding regulatory subunit McrB